MARSNQFLEAEVIPAWKTFLGDLFDPGDSGELADALRDVPESRAKGRRYRRRPKERRKDHRATWLRAHLAQTRDTGIGRPIARVVWGMGEAAATFDGNEWVSGPLALFAAGYFEAFVRVMAAAHEHGVSKRTMLTLTEFADAAVRGSQLQVRARSLVTFTGMRVATGTASSRTHQRHLRDRRAIAKIHDKARRAWMLSDATRAMFVKAWNDRNRVSLEVSPLLFMAAETERHPCWGLGEQRTIVVSFLHRWFEIS